MNVSLSFFEFIQIFLEILLIFLLVINKPTKPNILKQIRYEFNHKERISRDILNDVEASKFMCERLCIHPSKEGEIQGFVQKISQQPFGMILLSTIQVITYNITNFILNLLNIK
jgi:hypothetical protein